MTQPKIRTLIVDDEPDIRQLLLTILSMTSDFETVGTAANGREAIELAAELQPDLILLDVRMPTLDGIAALPHLRIEAQHAKVVFLSVLEGWLLEHDPNVQPDAIISKAVLPQRLVTELRQVMAR